MTFRPLKRRHPGRGYVVDCRGSRRIAVSFDADTFEQLRERARSDGKPIATLVRSYVEREVSADRTGDGQFITDAERKRLFAAASGALRRSAVQLDSSIDTIEQVAGRLHHSGLHDLANTLDAELRKLRRLRR